MFSHLKFAFRSLRKSPGFTAVVVLILALGIGVNTAIFSLFHQFILRPLPVPEPEKLVNLSAPGPKPGRGSSGIFGGNEDVFSYPMFRDLERVQSVFTGIAAHELFKANLAYKGHVRDGAGLFVSGSYFAVLRVHPALGRLLGSADDATVGGAEVAVLSYDYWRERFAADPGVLNDTLIVNGQLLTIVGVAPRGFESTAAGIKPQVFVPITLKGIVDRRQFNALQSLEDRTSYWVNLFARLRPGVSIDQARARINVAYRAVLNDVEAKLQSGIDPKTLALFRAKEIVLEGGAQGRSVLRAAMDTPFRLLLGVTALVLLIACANVTVLLLARGAGRSGEIALRLSLGAARRQVVAQLLTESCVLAICGGITGLACAHGLLSLTASFLPGEFAGAVSVTVGTTTLLCTTTLVLGTALLSGLLPALRSTRTDLLLAVKGQGTQLSAGRGATRLRAGLVASQAVMAMLLLVPAGLLIESLSNIGRVDLGLKVDSLVTFRISPELNGYSPERSRALFERLENELAALPGVTGVAASLVPLISNSAWGTTVSVQGFPTTSKIPPEAKFNKIGAGYFRTLGMPLIAGREFSNSDASGAGKVAVVNAQFARRFNLGSDAVGKWIAPYGGVDLDTRIVGVVQDAKYDTVKGETPPQFFLPYRQDDTLGAISFYVRSARQPEQALLMAAKAATRLDPNLPIEEPKTVARQVGENIFLDRLLGALCAGFAVLATLLVAIGLYGMLAYTVAQRTREIGLRMAMGALPRMVAWPIVRGAVRLAGIGVVVGGLFALALTRFMRHILFGVEPDNPFTLIGAAMLLLVVATTAACIPAWRASRIDPMVALRTE